MTPTTYRKIVSELKFHPYREYCLFLLRSMMEQESLGDEEAAERFHVQYLNALDQPHR